MLLSASKVHASASLSTFAVVISASSEYLVLRTSKL